MWFVERTQPYSVDLWNQTFHLGPFDRGDRNTAGLSSFVPVQSIADGQKELRGRHENHTDAEEGEQRVPQKTKTNEPRDEHGDDSDPSPLGIV